MLYIYIVYTSILSHSTIWIVLSSYIFCVSWINIPNNGKFVLLFGRYISYIYIYNFTSTLYIVNRRVIKCLARSIYGKRKKKIKRVSRVIPTFFIFSSVSSMIRETNIEYRRNIYSTLWVLTADWYSKISITIPWTQWALHTHIVVVHLQHILWFFFTLSETLKHFLVLEHIKCTHI